MLYIASAQQLNLFQNAFGSTTSAQVGSIIVLLLLFWTVYRFALSYVIRWLGLRVGNQTFSSELGFRSVYLEFAYYKLNSLC